VSGGNIENVYRLQIMNSAEKRHHFRITAQGMQGLKVFTESENFVVESTQSRWVSVRLQVPYESATAGTYPVLFSIQAFGDDEMSQEKIEEKSVFLVPR
jgi:polyferredoxin